MIYTYFWKEYILEYNNSIISDWDAPLHMIKKFETESDALLFANNLLYKKIEKIK